MHSATLPSGVFTAVHSSSPTIPEGKVCRSMSDTIIVVGFVMIRILVLECRSNFAVIKSGRDRPGCRSYTCREWIRSSYYCRGATYARRYLDRLYIAVVRCRPGERRRRSVRFKANITEGLEQTSQQSPEATRMPLSGTRLAINV